jgi:hypothetical protein
VNASLPDSLQTKPAVPMLYRLLRAVGVSLTAAMFLAGALAWPAPPIQAQTPSPKPGDKNTATGQSSGQKLDEYTEIQREVTGPAGNPECVWLGRRVVSLLWRDDLETAFRHLDLYDRFGCPGGHIQAAFRCLILHANSIDPKAPDSLNGRVEACWINPSEPAPPAPAASAAPGPKAGR